MTHKDSLRQAKATHDAERQLRTSKSHGCRRKTAHGIQNQGMTRSRMRHKNAYDTQRHVQCLTHKSRVKHKRSKAMIGTSSV